MRANPSRIAQKAQLPSGSAPHHRRHQIHKRAQAQDHQQKVEP
jgi:hypothetical protein